MLNYIKAELYKACRRKYAWIMLFAMLGLESLFALLWVGSNDFAYMVSLMTTTMSLGSFLAILLADVVVSAPGKTGALKNEAAFGIGRSGIYLGKLSTAVIVALLFCAVLFAWYLGGCWLFSQHNDQEAARASLGILGYVTAASLPLWLGTLSLSLCLYMTLRSEFAGAVAVVGLLTMGANVLGIIAMLEIGPVARVAAILSELFPVAYIQQYSGALTWALMIKNWAVGLGWTAVSTFVGIAVFQKRDIK